MAPQGLSPSTEKLWDAYVAAERDRLRAMMLPALDAFLDSLLREEPPVWKGWAKGLARDVADGGKEQPVRMQLFKRAIAPALVEGVALREPGAARWLAHFEPLFYHCRDELPPGLRSAEALFREALRVDPNDEGSRRAFVECVASTLEYSLHELPAGVLWDQDGATAEQCEELSALLEEFRASVEQLGETSTYTELIAECGLHFREYRAYLALERPTASYAEYLRSIGATSGSVD